MFQLGEAGVSQVLLDYSRVVDDHQGIRRGKEFLRDPIQFPRRPDIILIAQEYNITGTQRDGLLKVFYITQILRIPVYSNFKGSFRFEPFKDSEGFIV